MKKNLKQLRQEKILSQQELANLSGISLRTIQRIEKNESKGSPYVIKTLSLALDVEPQTIYFESADPDQNKPDGAREITATESINNVHIAHNVATEIKYINFSALLVLLIPFANLLIAPALYFLFKKKLTYPMYKASALKILSFQIIWSAATLVLLIATPVFSFCFPSIPASIIEIPLFVWVYWFMLTFHLISTFVISFQLNKTAHPIQFMPNIL